MHLDTFSFDAYLIVGILCYIVMKKIREILTKRSFL
jgi:hypothetical protein